MLIHSIIIEDETEAVEKLQRLLGQMDDQIIVMEILPSVHDAVKWLTSHTCDLIFLDIHLGDGNSFEIFKEIRIQTPIIFTTAYDEFALKAFEQNSVAYLLKPFSVADLQKALQKYKSLYHRPESNPPSIDYQGLLRALKNDKDKWKKNFLIQIGQKLKTISIEEVAYFYAHEKNTFIVTEKGRRYPIDETLGQLEGQTDPELFFRLNRKFLINRAAIRDVYYLSAARIKLELYPKPEFETLVPIEKIGKFKRWLAE
jgi:two-component system, LytTR family, response regulator